MTKDRDAHPAQSSAAAPDGSDAPNTEGRSGSGPTLRRGWTTGACATAATRAALMALWGEGMPALVRITLPRGERPQFEVVGAKLGADWAEAGIIKDAGDDPDVTHGAEIRVRVRTSRAPATEAHLTGEGAAVRFLAGAGVGQVTKPGLPVAVGEPAINPVPRAMMHAQVVEMAKRLGVSDPYIDIEVSIPDGAALAAKTWNPRLGIKGGLSVLGTTGIVRPFSCAAWIASIHRGVDVARAEGLTHVAGCTGATSERVVRALYDLPEGAMLDMGDFAGGLLKYLVKHPVRRVTLGGGIGKMAKLAQGEIDLHSKRSQVDLAYWAAQLDDPELAQCNTALEVYARAGADFALLVAQKALRAVETRFAAGSAHFDIVVIDRGGDIIARAESGEDRDEMSGGTGA